MITMGDKMRFHFPGYDGYCEQHHVVEAVISGDFEPATRHYDGCAPDVEIQDQPGCDCLGSDGEIREKIIIELEENQ